MRSMFVAGAKQVAATIDDPIVKAAWNSDSVLERQSIGSLAGHLARGSVWVVEDYLDRGVPDGPVDFDSAGHYFAAVMDAADEAMHAEIRARGAALAEEGFDDIVERLHAAVAGLEPRLDTEPRDRLIEVIGGKVMRLDDYLHTRIVEQVVHLDDLARSLDRSAPRFAPGTVQITIACAMEIGRRRHGAVELMRSLYRDPNNGALPVLA
jgi:hypothetical protein